MNSKTFDFILNKINEKVRFKDINYCTSVAPIEKLLITLRYILIILLEIFNNQTLN